MGSGKGRQTQTQNTSQSQEWGPPDDVAARYRDFLTRAENLSNQGFQSYGGERTAGFTQDQLAAFQGIRDAQGISQPYLTQAADYLRMGAVPAYQNVGNYMSPYTQQVVDATLRNFAESNAQQQQQVTGNAALKGALGGDRVSVAQAELARQQKLAQDPTIAGLFDKGFQTALTAAQGDAWRASNVGQAYGNLGQTAQNLALQGAGALYGAGAAQQGLDQSRLNTSYQDFLEERSFPYQTLQYLGGLYSGLGPLLGGYSEGTGNSTTVKTGGNSMWKDILGAGVTAAGLFARSDRRLKQDVQRIGELKDGTPVYRFRFKGDPKMQIGLMAQDVRKRHPEAVARDAEGLLMVDYEAATEAAARKKFAQGGFAMPYGGETGPGGVPFIQIRPAEFRPPAMSQPSVPQFGEEGEKKDSSASDLFGQAIKLAGSIKGFGGSGATASTWGEASSMLGDGSGIFAAGGAVRPGIIVPRGYFDGGFVDAFDDRWSAVDDALTSGEFDPQGANYPAPLMLPSAPAVEAWRLGVDEDRGAGVVADTTGGFGAPADTGAPLGFAPAPRSSAAALPMELRPSGAPLDLRPSEAAIAAAPDEVSAQEKKKGFGLGLISDDVADALLAAGLGIMASRSDNIAQALGEGGLKGLATYQNIQHRRSADAISKKRIEHEAKRLDDAARRAERELAERTRHNQETEGIQREKLTQERYTYIGVNEEGKPIYYDRNSGREVVGEQKVTGRPGVGGRTGWREETITKLREENPSLSYAEALALTQRAPQGDMAALRRETLALSAAKADVGYLRDPGGTIEKYRQRYGLGQSAQPSAPPAPKPQQGGALKPLTPEIRAKAQEALKKNAPRDAVIKRLRDAGYDPGDL